MDFLKLLISAFITTLPLIGIALLGIVAMGRSSAEKYYPPYKKGIQCFNMIYNRKLKKRRA